MWVMLIFEQLQTTSWADGSFGRLCFGFETVVKTFKHPVNYFNKWKLRYNASRLEKKTLIAEVQRSKEEEIS